MDIEKPKHMVGNMSFEDFNKLTYQEQCDYLNTLKPIATEGVDEMPLQVVEIDCSIEEYAARYNLVSFDELKKRINNMVDDAFEEAERLEAMTTEQLVEKLSAIPYEKFQENL